VSDERVRAAEIEWRRAGGSEAEARWLVERVRAGSTRRLHLEWLSFLGDDGAAAAVTLLEPRGRRGKKPSVRQRIAARESSLDARRRADTEGCDLFWYTLVVEDGQAALRALLAAVELTSLNDESPAALARFVIAPNSAIVSRRSDWSRVSSLAHDFITHHLVSRVEGGDEAFYDAMTTASRSVGRPTVLNVTRRALRAWWIDGEDIARRLSHGRA
jgi:hypothetical protein